MIPVTTTPTAVVADFWADFVEFLRQQLAARGHEVEPGATDQQLCIQFLNLLKRLIPPEPRRVLVSDVLACPEEVRAGFDLLKAKIFEGLDLTPHLSRRIGRHCNDPLLNDWGLHHLHLGINVDTEGFVEQGDLILLARFAPGVAYLIDIVRHRQWTNTDYMEILHRNWPASIERHRLYGVQVDATPTSDEVSVARRKRFNTLVRTKDGTVYAPPGGGISGAGSSMEVVRRLDWYRIQIKEWENIVREGASRFLEQAARRGSSPTLPLMFKLMIDREGRAIAVEPSQRLAWVLGEV